MQKFGARVRPRRITNISEAVGPQTAELLISNLDLRGGCKANVPGCSEDEMDIYGSRRQMLPWEMNNILIIFLFPL